MSTTGRVPEIEGPWFGCFTGDCPHETQAECDAAIRAECATMERTLSSLEAANAALLARVRSLQAENEKLLKQDATGTQTIYAAFEWMSRQPNPPTFRELADIGAEINRLRKDAARLNWLETAALTVHCNYIGGDEAFTVTDLNVMMMESTAYHGPTVRAAIDSWEASCPSIQRAAHPLEAPANVD